jgi:hypothetical protein
MNKKSNLDNLDDSSDDLYQEEDLSEELFDRNLYSDRRPTALRRGFVEDLEDRVDQILDSDQEDQHLADVLMEGLSEDDRLDHE